MSETLIEKAARLSSEKKYKESMYFYELALEADPNSPWACMGIAEIFSNLGQIKDALKWYNKTDIMALDNMAPWGYYKIAYAHYMLGNPDKAIAYIDKVLELDSSYHHAWFAKGVILSDCYDMTRMHKRATDAMHCYDMELESYPDDADAMYNKGLILEQTGKNQEALECFEGVIRLMPKQASAYISKGDILSYLNKYDDAIACYDIALELEPNSASGMYNKSRLLYFLDKIQEASDMLEKAAAINPNLPDVDELKKMLNRRIEFSRDIHKKTYRQRKD